MLCRKALRDNVYPSLEQWVFHHRAIPKKHRRDICKIILCVFEPGNNFF